MAAAAACSIVISAAPGSKGSHLTAELTWTLILAAQKKLLEEYDNVKNGGWQTTVGASGLYNLTLGVIVSFVPETSNNLIMLFMYIFSFPRGLEKLDKL